MNPEAYLLEQEAELAFREAIQAIWIQIQRHDQPSFDFGRPSVLTEKKANWFAVEKIVNVLHGRVQGRDTRTKDELAREIWASVKYRLSFDVLDSRIEVITERNKTQACIWIQLPFVFVEPLPPLPLEPLDREKLNSPEHINWIRVGLALREMGPCLAVALHDSAKNFHDLILADMSSCRIAQADFNAGLTLYNPETGSNIDLWADTIKAHHMGGKVNWSNSDATKWRVPEGFFEVMKLFCAPMGKHEDAIKKTSASDVDFSSLTAMLQLCDHFKASNANAEKRRKGLIRAAAGARNPWAHNQRLEFTKEQSEQHLQAFCALLEQEPTLAKLPAAQEALKNIHHIRDRELTIAQVEDSELRGIEDQRALMAQVDQVRMQIQGVSEQVQRLAESNSTGQAALFAQNQENLRIQARAQEASARVLREGAGGSAGAGSSSRRMHITYSREDSEVVMKVQDAASKMKWQITGVMFNQGKEWYSAWETALENTEGVCVFFTEGDAIVLNNHGVGYKEKLSTRFREQGKDAALYREAKAILAIKERRPEFKIYVVDGINYTPELLAFNPPFNLHDNFMNKWREFVEGGCQRAGTKSEGAGSVTRRGMHIVSALCSLRTATDADRLVAEVPGAERLNRESAAVKAAGAHTLHPASVEELVDNIEDRNPSLVHIAGHNQYLEGEPRIVGFSEGDDGDGLTELGPGRLAQLVVNAAALNSEHRVCP
jgi:hypothetical protein